jgi:hypothetical protein
MFLKTRLRTSRGIFHELERPKAMGIGIGQEPVMLVVHMLVIRRNAHIGTDGYDK